MRHKSAFTIVALAGSIALSYGIYVYGAFPRASAAYVYYPLTDEIFRVRLKPRGSEAGHLKRLIASTSSSMGKVDSTDYLGRFTPLLERTKTDRWRSSVRSLDEVASWRLEFFRREDLPVTEMLPPQFHDWIPASVEDANDLISVDAVVMERKLHQAVEVRTLRGALLIQGGLARAVTALGL